MLKSFDKPKELPVTKILSNWLTTSTFIYEEDVRVDDLKALLRHEVLNKNRQLIVERLKTRLLNRVKREIQHELEQDIKDLYKGDDVDV